MFNPSPSADAARGRRTMPNQDSMREQHLSADNDSLVAENARLQARVEEAERRSHKGGWVCDCDCHEEIDGLEGADYKALAERRKEALKGLYEDLQGRLNASTEGATVADGLVNGEDANRSWRFWLSDVMSTHGDIARAAIEEEEPR